MYLLQTCAGACTGSQPCTNLEKELSGPTRIFLPQVALPSWLAIVGRNFELPWQAWPK